MIIAFQTLIYFRESLLTALDWLIPIWPYYKKWTLTKHGEAEDDDEEEVFAEYDDEKGVVFYPPVYAQRYAAVTDCLMDERWSGRIEKVVDFGYHDMSFIKYLKDVPGIKCILGVDIETIPLRCSSDLLGSDDYAPKRDGPLQVTLYQGNAADPDYRLIGCDAVVAIEMIEHMMPHDLERLVHTVFGFIKPQIAIFTTPNADFNVLFKALERNGLRRMDHLFEWTREQFHDWCSNIVTRYPEYTVTCKGVGPGPPGTLHLGCCSQLALFICKDYYKQQDLDLDCLALVANAPKHNDLDDMTDSWVSPDPITETNMLCAPDNADSYSDIYSAKHSYMTIIIASPNPSFENLEYKDMTSQCNLDTEFGKNFLMFDEEVLCYNVLVPQRKIATKVYEFEDVASRLNCSTFQVKKFSKTTKNLMARNKLDSLVHTREIVDEIRHMTKMLNFNKNSLTKCSTDGSNTWHNINWGENAPYWNQYYNTVKEYNYPFETKSEECRIIDLISEEINRLIDAQDKQFAVDVNKLEIPMYHLMRLVEHITDDTDRVTDLLQWNGYEIVDDVLIYSRLVLDTTSVGSQDDEWPENDALSDWDTTDIQSLSDGSTMMPDIYVQGPPARCLRRALDLKVKKLKSLLTADEDITTELDRIVCRLMKLALRTSKDHQTPPPASWMQRKLLDLLSLTEKAIERRRKDFIENYPLKAIEYDYQDSHLRDAITLSRIKDDNTADKIVDKYLMLSGDLASDNNLVVKSEVHYAEDNLSATSNDMEPFIIEPKSMFEGVLLESMKSDSKEEIRLEITQAWVDRDFDIVPHDNSYVTKSDVESASSNTSNDSQYRHQKKHRRISNMDDVQKFGSSNLHTKSTNKLLISGKGSKIKGRPSKNKLIKKVSKKHSSSGNLAKSYSKKFEFVEYKSYTFKPKRNFREHHYSQSTSSKPIPRSLIELCYQDLSAEKSDKELFSSIPNESLDTVEVCDNVAATKESLFIGIVTEEDEETLALRRTIATEADDKSHSLEPESLLETVINVTKDDSSEGDQESDTIFLYDLNEPTTSKGIRHISADVQCGSDIPIVCPTPSANTSLTNMPKYYAAGIKISDSLTNLNVNKRTVDFGTVTIENNLSNSLYALNSKSIKMKDSDSNIVRNIECATMTTESYFKLISTFQTIGSKGDPAIKMLTTVYNGLNIEDSTSELRECNINSQAHSPNLSLKNTSNGGLSQITCVTKHARPKLSCCGIHVHSYRDRQVSEDVVFLGEWQRSKPKIVARKGARLPNIHSKKFEIPNKKRKVDSKEKICLGNSDNKVPVKKFVQINKKLINAKQEINSKEYNTKMNVTKSAIKNERSNKNASKVASKIVAKVISTKSIKNICATKRTTLANSVNKKEENITQNNINKNKILASNVKTRKPTIGTNKLNQSADYPKTPVKDKPVSPFLRSKTEEMLKFSNDKRKNITYLVFRNEIENSRSAVLDNQSSVNSKVLPKINNVNRSNHSPQSQHSSPCSSPNSIVTVRALNTRAKISCGNKNNSTSSENISSDNIEHCKTKKYFKRSKSTKKLDLSRENKENLPESSKNHDTCEKELDKSTKNMIINRNNNIFMVQMRAESPESTTRTISGSKTRSVKESNTKGLRNKNANTQRALRPLCFKTSFSNDSPILNKHDINMFDGSNINSEDFLVPGINHLTRSSTPKIDSENEGSPGDCTTNSNNNIKSSKSRIIAAIKQLIEERLSFIKKSRDNDSDSETIILSRDGDLDKSFDGSSSPISYRTVLNNDNICKFSGSDLENALLNYSFNSNLESMATLGSPDSRYPCTDTDLMSFTSNKSLSTFSESFITNNDLDQTLIPEESANKTSVRDIFDRRDQYATTTTVPNKGGIIAVQVFSGFSMNGEPLVGDQPEYVSLVDPLTGNMTLEIARQATSEEIFVSGRSSDTYESCLIDDDTFVPNWLFHVISQQQSVDEQGEEDDEDFPDPPDNALDEAEYDVNGNELDPVIGVGAGDGRGMHSDQSQDSSGRGTSISSSDVSSGPQSEAILIDPSTFLGLAPGALPGTESAAVAVDSSDASFRTVETMENDNELQYSGETMITRRLNRLTVVSDIDADVSSLETDAADSDN